MSMTRKHFQSLAESTAEILDDLTSKAEGGRGIGQLTFGQQDRITIALADFCSRQNPRFDRQRFAQAISAMRQSIQCDRNAVMPTHELAPFG